MDWKVMNKENKPYFEGFSLADYLDAHKRDDIHREAFVFKRGENIYLPGDDNCLMYEIHAGAVKLGSYLNGEEVIYDALSAQDYFGNLQYLGGGIFYEFARALVDTSVTMYKIKHFRHLIIADYQVSEWFKYYLVKRWNRTERKFFQLNSRGVYAKLEFIYNVYNHEIADAQGRKYNFFHLLTNNDIGNLTGTTRQTIATNLKKLLGENDN